MAAHRDGLLGEAGHGHPDGDVVDVDGRLDATARGVEKRRKREGVHAAMAADGCLVVLLPKGMVVLRVELVDRIPMVLGVGVAGGIDQLDRGTDAVDVDAVGVLQLDAPSPLHAAVS